jgi:asparagine synthase (glutamine-hydrolysing)
MAGRPPLPRSTPCYTYGGFYRDCYDVSAASKIAAAAGQPHQVIPLGRDFFSDFADHAENTVWLTDGYMDISGSHELYYSRRARDIAPIRITGNYGSEVLRSHSTFGGAVPSGDVYSEEMIPYCKQALSTFAAIKRRHEVSFSAMEEVPFHLYGKLALAQSQLIVRSPYMDNRLVSLVYRGPAIRKTPEFSLRLVKDLNPALVGIQTDMGFSGTESKIVGRPRQAYRYATFKAEWYYNLGMTDWLAAFDRPVLKRFEPLFLGTHKIDHYRVWFRDYLLTYVRDMLSSSAIATRPYVRRQALEQLTRTDRITGRYVQDVSRLITLELIHKLFLSSTPSSRQAVVGSGSLAGAWKK